MECPFCNIDKSRTVVVREKKYVFVAFSNPRLMKDHMLVIPKRHVEKLSELTKEEKAELLDTLIEYQEKLLKKYSGCDIKQNFRPFIPQHNLKVNHLHFHLQPREFEDELYKKSQIHEKEIFKDLTKDEMKVPDYLFK